MIEVKGLCKSYGEKQALRDVSFSVMAGEIVGLIGKNGAGKSTILKSISGLLHYDSGEIYCNGVNCRSNPYLVQDFGILIECAFLDYINAYDNLKLLYNVDERNDPKEADRDISHVFELVGLSDVKMKRVKSYSFGMKQRLGLAQAILSARNFMMLDEPFIGLDPLGKEIVKKAIQKKAKEDNFAVLFSSHDLDDVAEICDKIVMIEDGVCIYNDVIKKNSTYTIFFAADDANKDEMQKELCALSRDIELMEASLTFTDKEEAPILNNVLQCIIKYSHVNKIEVSDNMLTGMFKKEEE
jgi:ABC-2 type transport system ATP-binding protein